MTPAPPAPPIELVPRYMPGHRVSGFAFAPVLAGQFVKIAGDKLQIDTPNVLSGETVMPGDYRIAACGAGERAFGVAERSTPGAGIDAVYNPYAQDFRVTVARRLSIARVLAGAPVDAGFPVMSDAQGRAVPATGTGAAAASTSTGVVASNNAITYTAKEAGEAGTGISVSQVNPGTVNAALAVSVNGEQITVSLATDGGGAITSTASQVIAAVAANGPASALVAAANQGASTGAGVVPAVAQTALVGGSDPTSETPTILGQACSSVTQVGSIVEVDLF